MVFVIVLAGLLDEHIIPLFPIYEYDVVNLTLTTQFLVLPVSLIAVAIMYFYDKKNFKEYFRFSLTSPFNNEWNVYGPLVAAGFTIGNIMLMSFSVIHEHGTINGTFIKLLPLVLLFAATNAWSEEIFTRFVIVSGLSGRLPSGTIVMISAAIFGAGHIFGTPGGLFGVIASGTLGWFLARSVVDTKSMGWALLIHFLQDIIIFGAGAMIIAGNEN